MVHLLVKLLVLDSEMVAGSANGQSTQIALDDTQVRYI